jgi:hypothetical protein
VSCGFLQTLTPGPHLTIAEVGEYDAAHPPEALALLGLSVQNQIP